MSFSLSFLFLLTLFYTVASGGYIYVQTEGQGFFTSPGRIGADGDFTDNPIWSVGTVQQLSWKWTEEAEANFSIYLWCQVPDVGIVKGAPIFQVKSSATDPGRYEWNVTKQWFDLQVSNVFMFWVIKGVDNQDQGTLFTSHYVNITNDEANSLTTSTTSPQASAPAAETNSTATSPAPSSLSNTPPGATNGKEDKTIKVALGVGLGVGIPLILLLSVLIGMRVLAARRKKKVSRPKMYSSPPKGIYTNESYTIYPELGAHSQLAEVASHAEPQELGNGHR